MGHIQHAPLTSPAHTLPTHTLQVKAKGHRTITFSEFKEALNLVCREKAMGLNIIVAAVCSSVPVATLTPTPAVPAPLPPTLIRA